MNPRADPMLDDVIRSRVPYPGDRFSGRGIVICAGGPRLFTCAWVCVSMLRRQLGCALPIQVWYLGPEEMDRRMIGLLGTLDVECVDAVEVSRRHPVRRLGGWESKPYALMHSRFREVILLDADNVPVREPGVVLENPAYADTGAVFWPDLRPLGPRRTIWKVCRVPYRNEPAFESGQVVVDKARCWQALRVTMHLNEHSDHYYPHTQGDKETFHMAWRMLDQRWGMPPFPCRPLRYPGGQAGAGDGRPAALCQHGFDGQVLFQHRNGAKWILDGVNPRIPGFRFHEACVSSLVDLGRVWDGRVTGDAGGATPLRPDAPGASTGRWFRYRRVSSDERLLELLPDGRIGRGGTRTERSWRLRGGQEGARLEILGEGFVTCGLTRAPDGVWKGRWLHFERMPVELAPVAPGADAWLAVAGESDAAPAPATGGAQPSSVNEPVDAVYTWVDGADPPFRDTLARYASLQHVSDLDVIGAHRFRDNGELRYSLRSLERFAPWIRRVYLVTNGQVPAWLDTTEPRIAVIPHAAIFPDPGDLPTFNSNAIELHLHRIPNLARRFLYFNDDMFLGNSVSLEDFQTVGGRQRIRVERWRLAASRSHGPIHARAWAHTQRLLDAAHRPRRTRAMLARVPQLYDRDRITAIEARWHAEVRRTSSHRFRAADDLALRVLYSYSLLEGPRRDAEPEVVTRSPDYCFARMKATGGVLRWWLPRIGALRPKFFCINDDRPGTAPDGGTGALLKAFLAWYFPRPSRFERVPAHGPRDG